MKSRQEIEREVKLRLSCELNRRFKEACMRLPGHCKYNLAHPLTLNKQSPNYNKVSTSSSTIGLCMYGAETPESWPGNICEDPVDAQRCDIFDYNLCKKDIYDIFIRDINDPSWLADNMPSVYCLLWVLDFANVKLPWWRRWWFRLMPLKVEPAYNIKSYLTNPL